MLANAKVRRRITVNTSRYRHSSSRRHLLHGNVQAGNMQKNTHRQQHRHAQEKAGTSTRKGR
jgi:hypothetical protein